MTSLVHVPPFMYQARIPSCKRSPLMHQARIPSRRRCLFMNQARIPYHRRCPFMSQARIPSCGRSPFMYQARIPSRGSPCSLGSEVGLAGSLRLPGHWSRLGRNMSQNHHVFLSKVARPSISHERGEGGYHEVRSLRTKVVRRFCPESIEQHRALTPNR